MKFSSHLTEAILLKRILRFMGEVVLQGVVFLGVIALLMFGLSKLYTYAFRRSDAAVPATNPEPQSLLPAQRVHGMNQPENTSGAPRRGLHFQFGDDAAESVQTVASDHSNESRSNRFRL